MAARRPPAKKKAPVKKPVRKPAPTPGADRLAKGALAALGVVLVVALLFAFQVPAMAARASGEALGRMGLKVRSIEVKGAEKTESDAIYSAALGQRAKALPLVDVEALRAELLDFPYMKDARVSRRYPDTLVIDVIERSPHALWQGEDRLFLIDAEGAVLERVRISEMPDLPLVIGAGANRQLDQLDRLLDRVPDLRADLASASWVGGRRWDLNVESGEILALPEGEREAGDALEKFMTMHRRAALLGIGVERYDLRLPGRAIARSPAFANREEEEN